MTDEVLEGIMWEAARPWEERWETLKVDESRVQEQETDDVIYILEFKSVSDTGE